MCQSRYAVVEKEFIDYVRKRSEAYQQDKCGLSWLIMKDKALFIYDNLFPPSERDPHFPIFKASSSWISKTLKRNNIVGVSLHGEASDVDPIDSVIAMEAFRTNLDNICR